MRDGATRAYREVHVLEGEMGVILKGPEPNDRGTVDFIVEVEGRPIAVSASPLGVGAEMTEPLELVNRAMAVVAGHVKANRSTLQDLYREAARLRRAAGNAPLVGNTRSEEVRLQLPPQVKKSGLLLKTRTRGVEVRVLILKGGGLIDDCDEWDSMNDLDRDAAITAALDWVFANIPMAEQAGLDVGLLEELWR